MSTILTFENTEFDVVDIHNVAWLRGPQIAGALGYNRDDRLADLYGRNADEFTEEMTQVLDLPTAGGVQPVRVFSPRGCYLLGMLARTEKAKAFRQWVLDVLEGRVVPQQIGHMSHGQRLAYLKERRSLLRELLGHTTAGMRAALHGQLRYVSRLLGMPCPEMGAIGRTVEQPELPGL
jgi:prophage antirepressor-like protein